MRELQPINQNVILDLTEIDSVQKTNSGIIIPDTVSIKKNIARVIAVGNIDNAEITAGDTVIYKEYGGNEIEFDGKKFLILPYADILVKVVETEEI